MTQEEIAALPNAKCWQCGCEVNSKASVLCQSCHKIEVARVHKHDTPSAPDWKLVGDYVIPRSRSSRPTAKGKRVLRNEKSLQ